MKHTIVIIIVSFVLNTFVAYSQVGVFTEPLTVFHVDAGKDNTTTNPNRMLNDVCVTSSGNIGIGTITPTTRLEIHQDPNVASSVRIVDGSSMTNKILQSNADGTARWALQPLPNMRNYKATANQGFVPLSDVPLQLDGCTNGRLVVPYEGKYQVTLRWYSLVANSPNVTHPGVQSVYVYLVLDDGTANGVVLDQIEYYSDAVKGERFVFTTTLYARHRLVGDKLYLRIRPEVGRPATGVVHMQLSNGSAFPLPVVVLYTI